MKKGNQNVNVLKESQCAYILRVSFVLFSQMTINIENKTLFKKYICKCFFCECETVNEFIIHKCYFVNENVNTFLFLISELDFITENRIVGKEIYKTSNT